MKKFSIQFFWLFILMWVLQYNMIHAQNFEGVISFDRTYYWVKVNNQLPYLSKEEKDRMQYTYGVKDGWTTKMKLYVSDNHTLYTYDHDVPQEEGWSWRQDEWIIYRDLTNMKRKDMIESMNKAFLIDEDLKFPKWKILNEIKEVAGYLCMKAETVDTIKNQKIVAWFTDQIPVNGGPEQLSSLPGMILELDINNGSVMITATNVAKTKLEKGLPLPKKWKGKKITNVEYQAKIKQYLTESVENKRNPYWTIRY